jgi:hypothetical protein
MNQINLLYDELRLVRHLPRKLRKITTMFIQSKAGKMQSVPKYTKFPRAFFATPFIYRGLNTKFLHNPSSGCYLNYKSNFHFKLSFSNRRNFMLIHISPSWKKVYVYDGGLSGLRTRGLLVFNLIKIQQEGSSLEDRRMDGRTGTICPIFVLLMNVVQRMHNNWSPTGKRTRYVQNTSQTTTVRS